MMKKYVSGLLLLMILCLILTACSDSDEPSTDNYYVRYTVVGKPDNMMNVYFTTESGESTLIQTALPDGKLQYAFGPVSKGFNAGVTASYYDGSGPASLLSIEVARGSEPFVLKKKGTNYFSLEYTID